MSDILALVFFAMMGNADEWSVIEIFGKEHEKFLRRYLELPNGITSHYTIQRVFTMISPDSFENEMLSSEKGEKIKTILAIDG